MASINRRHILNEHYFDKINTEEKAYWLGFIWADGSISKTAKRAVAANRLTIAQKPSEKHHLQRFLDAIDSDYELKPRKSTGVYVTHVNSRPMCDTLINMGYGTKDKRTSIPKLPADLLHHFIRGYFDGDGCLSLYDQKIKQWTVHRQEWSITGHPDFIQNVRNVLEQHADVTDTVKMKPYKQTQKAITLRYGKKADIVKLYDYMYENATIFLESKYQKFMQYFSR